MRTLKIKIKSSLILKNARLRKELKIYKEKLEEELDNNKKYIDKINTMQNEIRELLLLLPKEERELWLRKKGKNNERHTFKKKRTKRKVN